jgi:TonB family protein
MAADVLAALTAFSLQFALVAAAGATAVMALGLSRHPQARLALWRAVLAAVLVIPALARVGPPASHGPATEAPAAITFLAGSLAWQPPAGGGGAARWPVVVLSVLAAGILLRVAWLLTGAVKLRRLRHAADAPLPLLDQLACDLGCRPRVVTSACRQPFTFGLRDPIVVVPDGFEREPDPVQRAVLTHELVHVARRDWLHTAIEELVCAVLWFHPLVWWVAGELRQAREEIVDRIAARRVGSRRTYSGTLVTFALRHDAPSPRALAFFRTRQLARRLRSLAREAPMSTRHLVPSALAALLLLGGTVHTARAFFPLHLGAQTPNQPSPLDPEALSQPSALERQAYTVPKDGKPPRKIHDVKFPYPPDVKSVVTSALFTVRVVVDVDGSVAEARLLKRQVSGPPVEAAVLADAVERLSQGTLATVRQWRFEPPAKAPLAMTVTVNYRADDGEKPPAESGVELPVPIQEPNPIYPPEALAAGIQGSVELRVTVGADGLVKDAVVRHSVPALDQAALDAVRLWTFRPGTKNGEPVEVVVDIEMVFTLKD